MLKKLILALAALTLFAFTTPTAFGFGAYADIPLNFTFDDCTNCKYDSTPSGLKAGVVMGNGVGLGITTFDVKGTGASSNITASFTLFDVSYLLPIPLINLTAGISGGPVSIGDGNFDLEGNMMGPWASIGFPILIADIHIGYHKYKGNASNDLGGVTVTQVMDSTMISIGTLINF